MNNPYDISDESSIQQIRVAVCLFWLLGDKQEKVPTDQTSHLLEPQWGPLEPPPL